MSDFRAFCSPSSPSVTELTLSAAESHHLITVNRARRGDAVVAFDGAGTEWLTEIVDANRRGTVLRVTETRPARPPACAITLFQALPKGGVMETIIRHATEIGVRRIVPLESARTQVHLNGARQSKKQDKWIATALEAAKQCGNPWLPEILPPQPMTAVPELLADIPLSLVASLQPESQPVAEAVAQRLATSGCPARAAWLIGPEGDFSPEEYAAIIAAGAAPVSLGPLVLRCDTAATYALAVLSAAVNP